MAESYPAVVTYAPEGHPTWRVENLQNPRSPNSGELKVRMAASGICHTDVFVSMIPAGMMGVEYPRVIGHEGAGIVEEVGPGVTVAKVGDPVLLSYDHCKVCDTCGEGKQPYCLNWEYLNILGAKKLFTTSSAQQADGKFFGQSSFAGMSIVSEASVVNVKDIINSNDDLKLLAPLGCGLMTGSGAIYNAAKGKPHDIVLVTGIGAVGLGAVMAAKILGCKEIIVVDRVAKRLEIAKELGATKTLDASDPSIDLADAVQKLVDGQRISYAVETTGVKTVILGALKALGKRGKLIQIGIPAPGTELTIPLYEVFNANKTFECHFLGDSTGAEMVPLMLKWWKEGNFPIEKIVKYFPVNEANAALQGMEDGSVIKPVIVW